MKTLNLLSISLVASLLMACVPEMEAPLEDQTGGVKPEPIIEENVEIPVIDEVDYAQVNGGGHYVSNHCVPNGEGNDFRKETLVVRDNYTTVDINGNATMEYYEGYELYFDSKCENVSIEIPNRTMFQNPVRELRGLSYDPSFELNGGVNPDAAQGVSIDVSPEIIRLYITDDITGDLVNVRYFLESDDDGSLTEYVYDLSADTFYETGTVFNLEYNSIQTYLQDQVVSPISSSDLIEATWVLDECTVNVDDGTSSTEAWRFTETGFLYIITGTFDNAECEGSNITTANIDFVIDIQYVSEENGVVTMSQRTVNANKGSNQWYDQDYTINDDGTMSFDTYNRTYTFTKLNP